MRLSNWWCWRQLKSGRDRREGIIQDGLAWRCPPLDGNLRSTQLPAKPNLAGVEDCYGFPNKYGSPTDGQNNRHVFPWIGLDW